MNPILWMILIMFGLLLSRIYNLSWDAINGIAIIILVLVTAFYAWKVNHQTEILQKRQDDEENRRKLQVRSEWEGLSFIVPQMHLTTIINEIEARYSQAEMRLIEENMKSTRSSSTISDEQNYEYKFEKEMWRGDINRKLTAIDEYMLETFKCKRDMVEKIGLIRYLFPDMPEEKITPLTNLGGILDILGTQECGGSSYDAINKWREDKKKEAKMIVGNGIAIPMNGLLSYIDGIINEEKTELENES